MDNFQKKFIEEATDLINNLEEALLSLENSPDDKSLINEIFRVMHSLKGGGAMFGFETVSNFTHNLETVYDYVRNDKLIVKQELLDITLASVDLLRNFLAKEEISNPEINKTSEELIAQIKNIIYKVENDTIQINSDNTLAVNNEQLFSNTVYILFKPNQEIFNDGTNPLYLIDELNNIGKAIIIPHTQNIPTLNNFIISHCYTYWEVLLSTSESLNAIHDVFIFVEGECELKILPVQNVEILNDPNFILNIEQLKYDQFFVLYDFLFSPKINEIKKNTSQNKESKTDKILKNSTTNNQQSSTNQNINKLSDKKHTESEDIKNQMRKFSNENSISSIRVSSEKIDQLMNLVSELVTNQASLSLVVDQQQIQGIHQIVENLENITRQLRDTAFTISLIPIEAVLTRYQRLIRDLASEFQKEINFKTEGAETELDKTLIQGLTEPLMHIIRNSIDHGIETVEERIKNGKPKQGTIMLKAFYSGANVVIKVSDDGRGIDLQKIKSKAISLGLISQDTFLSDKEILDLIFVPGFSTANNITDISGRGVGMDVVRKKISEIRGEVELQTKINVGTTITIKLPLTLSIIDGLLVRIEDTLFVIPLSVVDKIYAVTHTKIETSFNNILAIDGVQIPFYYLREEFGLNSKSPENEEIVVVKYEEKQIGIVVDLVVGEYQAVLKPLGRMYKKQEIFSGATILGDGTVALVMDTHKIINEYSYK